MIITMEKKILIVLVAMVILTIDAQDFTRNGCGSSKGCLQSPATCTGSTNCEFFASWTVNSANTELTFQISGTASGFVAIGFSKSGRMADSDVYACTSQLEVVRSRNTVDNVNDPSPELKGVSDVSVSLMDGRIECQFTRNISLNDNDDTYFDLNLMNTYHVIMSKANGLDPNGRDIAYHFGGKTIRPNQITSFLDFEAEEAPPVSGDGDGCGTTKGCFQSPSGCSGVDDCDFYLSWAKSGASNLLFEISGAATGYVALGFSKSGMMRDSDVYACTSDLEVARSRNTVGNTNDPSPELLGVSDVSVTVENGRVHCTFKRQISNSGHGSNFYSLEDPNKYFIIMSRSNVAPVDGNIGYHVGGRIIGPETSFNEFTVAVAERDIGEYLRKAHGSFMITAWVGLASVGIILARFYKPMWPGKQTCKKPIWFAMHRMCMVLTFVFTLGAFIMIFVAVGDFLTLNEGTSGLLRFLHAVFGCVVTFLAILNPVMAIFRPHPGEPKRWIFNWAHWFVGSSAHYIGWVTICLGLGYRAARPLIPTLPEWLFWLMIVFIAFHIVVKIILTVRHQQILNRTNSTSDIQLQDKQGDADNQPEPSKPSPSSKDTTIMTSLLFLYILVAWGIVIVLVFFIWEGTE